MEMNRVLICVLLMAAVTYIPRVLPVTIFRKQIKSRFIRSFLDYTPYAVLGALTFPDVFSSTGRSVLGRGRHAGGRGPGLPGKEPGGGGPGGHRGGLCAGTDRRDAVEIQHPAVF